MRPTGSAPTRRRLAEVALSDADLGFSGDPDRP